MLPDVGTSLSVHEGKVDTLEQPAIENAKQEKRRRRSVEEKRRIVEETLEAGASVARVARRHAVNANQVFYWRKKYREGRLGKNQSSKLLPVTLSDLATTDSDRAPHKSESDPGAPLFGFLAVQPRSLLFGRKRLVCLSITHKFSSKGEAQLDVGQAGQASPNDRVSGSCIAGTREIAPESRDPDQVSRN